MRPAGYASGLKAGRSPISTGFSWKIIAQFTLAQAFPLGKWGHKVKRRKKGRGGRATKIKQARLPSLKFLAVAQTVSELEEYVTKELDFGEK